jgi:hypothetical protein
LAAAGIFALEQMELEARQDPAQGRALVIARGREIGARSKAMQVDNQEDSVYWHEQLRQIDPTTDPRDVWIKTVRLHVDLTDAREKAATAGITYGRTLDSGNGGSDALTKQQQEYLRASIGATLCEKRIDLASVEFEISKREGLGDDPELPDLRKKRDAIQQAIKQLEQAATAPASQPK